MLGQGHVDIRHSLWDDCAVTFRNPAFPFSVLFPSWPSKHYGNPESVDLPRILLLVLPYPVIERLPLSHSQTIAES